MVSIKNNVIKITQGDTLRTRVIFFIRPGVVYEPSEGDKIRFALKSSRNPVDREVLLNIDVPVTTMELVIPADLSKKVPARTLPYFYDVEICFADGDVYTFIPDGTYYSLPEVV